MSAGNVNSTVMHEQDTLSRFRQSTSFLLSIIHHILLAAEYKYKPKKTIQCNNVTKQRAHLIQHCVLKGSQE